MSKLSLWRTMFLLCVFCAATAIASPAQTFKTLVNFDGNNGKYPYLMTLVQGTDGNLYGTTYAGGLFYDGTVFKITPGGKLTTLHSFDGADGAGPIAGLVLATDGNFYGTTVGAGANGYGTVFEITAGGTLTTLYSFCSKSGCADGGGPEAALVQATNGNFYGTTNGMYGAIGLGTLFKITPSGTLNSLHSFDGTDGEYPYAGLIQATNGDFYGTTYAGGAYGYGTVFKITSGGALTTVLCFDRADGANPAGALVQGTDGNFYGTAYAGGTNGDGTVFKITPGGTLTTLHNFDGADGSGPIAGLVQATDRNFYGTTYAGGTKGDGTVFKITPSGTLTTLHRFNGTDGLGPLAALVQATNGTFYGTTVSGGARDDCYGHPCGTVFSLTVGLGPFVETLPTSGKVGAPVIILGNNLTGATSVTFNGTATTFKVISSTEIKTTVPSGATTGKVEVKTPSRTLTSNVNFRVP